MSSVLAGKTIVVTGASGFVGSHLIKRLLTFGCDVHIITIANPDLSLLVSCLPQINVYEHDGSSEQLDNILASINPQIVYHLASYFVSEHDVRDIEQLINSNLKFGTQVVEAMVRNNCRNLVNTGTSWQHYNNEDYNPVCLYAATKQAFEDILEYYVQATGLRIVTLKLFDTYGPNDNRKKLFNLLRNTPDGVSLDMSPGEQLLNLVYIDDVINAFVLAGERLIDNTVKTYSHERYAVSAKEIIKLKDLVGIYLKMVNKSIEVNWGGRPYRIREVMLPWSTGKPLPGWLQKINLNKGITLLEKEFNVDEQN